MAEQVIRLPDVGEGVAEAELVEWHVKIGDLVREDTVLAAVMTDKATVEIPSPVDGEIVWLGASIGDVVAVGSDLVRLKVPGDGKPDAADQRIAPPAKAPALGLELSYLLTPFATVPDATPPSGDDAHTMLGTAMLAFHEHAHPLAVLKPRRAR